MAKQIATVESSSDPPKRTVVTVDVSLLLGAAAIAAAIVMGTCSTNQRIDDLNSSTDERIEGVTDRIDSIERDLNSSTDERIERDIRELRADDQRHVDRFIDMANESPSENIETDEGVHASPPIQMPATP